jgi:hypothetical protein
VKRAFTCQRCPVLTADTKGDVNPAMLELYGNNASRFNDLHLTRLEREIAFPRRRPKSARASRCAPPAAPAIFRALRQDGKRVTSVPCIVGLPGIMRYRYVSGVAQVSVKRARNPLPSIPATRPSPYHLSQLAPSLLIKARQLAFALK